MEIKNNPKELLINILKKYNTEDKVLFQLKYKYMLHIELSKGYQYLQDDSLNEDYIKECTKKAIEVFNFMKFCNNLLIIYDDIYHKHSEKQKNFIESTLRNTTQYHSYKLNWKFPGDNYTYTCNRHIYQVEEVDIQNLFKEIILSDIGGKMDLASSIFIIDIDTECIFHLYDDRGLFLYAQKEEDLLNVWKEFYNDVFVNCKDFKIKVNDLYWINKTKDDSNDLCLHGDVEVTIGEEELSYCDATVSASALRMLKTLTEDHLLTEREQMLPCCGHTMIANKTLDEVDIIGCDNGIDWTIIHENGMVKIITENENTVYVYYLQYKEEVLHFAYMVEDYYKKSSNKVLPEDEFERDGYIGFWNEWHRRID